MNVEIFTLCNYVEDNDGSQYITHTFDSFIVENKSEIFDFFIACKIRLNESEMDITHTFSFEIITPDGDVIPSEAKGSFNLQNLPGINGGVHLQIDNKMRFDSFGTYSINLLVDGKSVSTIPFFVRNKIK